MFNPTENYLHLSQAIGKILLQKKWTLCVAESCTGGAVASAITAVSGASQWFGYGLVTYSNQAKQSLLQVSAKTLLEKGAVSREVVLEMVRGALDLSGANVAVSISGIAGPDGGTPDKPVGSVWFGLAVGDELTAEFHHFTGDRLVVQQQAVIMALERILDLLGHQEKNTV